MKKRESIYRKGKRMIVALTNLKGGVAKTTSAIALAQAARNKGLTACVFDGDPQGSATSWAYKAEENNQELDYRVEVANMSSVAAIRNSKRLADFNVIDLPPQGHIVDRAVEQADFIIVPTSTSTVDLDKTIAVARMLDSQDYSYGVLITRYTPNTLSFKHAIDRLNDNGLSMFDTCIPKREAIAKAHGKPFEELFGYQEVFEELYANAR
jgi:chromosome partitioning protein